MDNRLNEIRRKIRTLRLEMLDLSGAIRAQMGRDEDCCNAALRLMAMRREMLALIDRRNAMGGREECPSVRPFKQEPRSLGNQRPRLNASKQRPRRRTPAQLANSCSAWDEKRPSISISPAGMNALNGTRMKPHV